MVMRKSGAATAEVDRLRAEVAAAIQAAVKAEGLSTLAAAKRTGIHRSEFSRLLNGHFEKFTLDRLVYIASALGVRCSLRLVGPKAGR
jgi:predicted XRE-type DNA-binding protein